MRTAGAVAILGDCTPAGGPEMLKYAGATTRTDSFYFRDIPDISQHTWLNASAYDLTYDDCTRGGSLNKKGGPSSCKVTLDAAIARDASTASCT